MANTYFKTSDAFKQYLQGLTLNQLDAEHASYTACLGNDDEDQNLIGRRLQIIASELAMRERTRKAMYYWK